MTARGYLGFLRGLQVPGLIGVTCLGAVLALIPAWLPERPQLPIEQHSVEVLQILFLAGTSILFFAAAGHTGRFSSAYRAMGWIALAAMVAEVAGGSERLWGLDVGWSNLAYVPLGIGVLHILRHPGSCSLFLRILTRRAGGGILITALLINYIFTPIFGSTAFWKEALGEQFTFQIPLILRSYLQLFACYLILVGATALSLNHPLARAGEEDSEEL